MRLTIPATLYLLLAAVLAACLAVLLLHRCAVAGVAALPAFAQALTPAAVIIAAACWRVAAGGGAA